jgi:uncharacterized protein (TIGR03435 family)
MRGALVVSFLATGIAVAQAPLWKEFSLAPAGKPDKPLERTAGWTFEPAGSRIVYPVCCPWLDAEGRIGRVANDPWSMRASGVSIKSLLARMSGLPQLRIVAPEWMSQERYDLTATVSDEYRLQFRRRDEAPPNPRDELRALVERELTERLQIRTRREKRDVPVFVLKTVPGTAPTLDGDAVPDGSRFLWARDGAFESMNANDLILLTWLQNVVQRPVFGEGLPAGPYRCDLKWRAGDVRSLATALWEQLGLVLVEQHREIEFLVVEAAVKPEWH